MHKACIRGDSIHSRRGPKNGPNMLQSQRAHPENLESCIWVLTTKRIPSELGGGCASDLRCQSRSPGKKKKIYIYTSSKEENDR